MSSTAPPSSDVAARSIEMAERQLRMLTRLAEIGMAIAEAAGERILAETQTLAVAEPADGRSDTPAPSPRAPIGRDVEAFTRISRCIRLTLALEARFDEALRILRDPSLARPAAGARRSGWADEPVAYDPPLLSPEHPVHLETGSQRDKVRELVWEALDSEITELGVAKEILDTFYERFDETDGHDRFFYRPIRETVEAICQDLGLNPDWSRWTGEGWEEGMRPEGRYWELNWAPTGKYYKAELARRQAEEALAALRPPPKRRE